MRKKIDNRIRNLIENGVTLGHRSIFILVGKKARDQVVILHHILSKAMVKSRPSVLWCYKKELGFSSHRKKRMKQLKKQIKNGNVDINEDDPFEFFISSTNIRYCYYAETNKILGNTYGMCLIQDFEALTPNILAQTIETVEGGGLIIFLLDNINSIEQLYTMSMDVHSRYKTESHMKVTGRFNERFLLSLTTCPRCLVLDDQLNLIPVSILSTTIEKITPKSEEEALTMSQIELKNLKQSFQDVQPIGSILKLSKTLDQAKALLKFVDIISEKVLRSTACLTAARGRGKSACLGLAIATAVAYGYSNIFVTSPHPDNLKTLFEFVIKGFSALSYEEHIDFEVQRSSNVLTAAKSIGGGSSSSGGDVVRLNIFKRHRQTVQYIGPGDWPKLAQAELLIIDEAAAIPLPLVKRLLGPYVCFMSSTVSGYEGTGRSLSLKLFKQLRERYAKSLAQTSGPNATTLDASSSGRAFYELRLGEPIRYADGDPAEAWLNSMLCLDISIAKPKIASGCPAPGLCDLYWIDRDTLFSYHKASEAFLQRLVSIYVASHYKNSPNDLQMLSDAPAHHIFCLLGPCDPNQPTLPEILCVVQVCLEGELSKESVLNSVARGKKASGDLIPWTISQQFQDYDFPHLSGGRIIRIATHPDYQRMGYGQRALELLTEFYEGKVISLVKMDVGSESKNHDLADLGDENGDESNEILKPRSALKPLLSRLSECEVIRLNYLGVSFGLTSDLLRFWKRAGYYPVYLRQTSNEITGEHSCIMLKRLSDKASCSGQSLYVVMNDWLANYRSDFARRFARLLSFQFRDFAPQTALSLLQNAPPKKDEISDDKDLKTTLTPAELKYHITISDLKRLSMYTQNLVDYPLIMDLLPVLAQLYFFNKLSHMPPLSLVQQAILLGIGLQRKTVADLEGEINLPSTQILGQFNRILRRISQYLNNILEENLDKELFNQNPETVTMEPTAVDLKTELDMVAKEIKHKQEVEKMKLMSTDFSRYAIKGTERDWDRALADIKQPIKLNLLSVGSTITKKAPKSHSILDSSIQSNDRTDEPNFGKREKKFKNKKKFKKFN